MGLVQGFALQIRSQLSRPWQLDHDRPLEPLVGLTRVPNFGLVPWVVHDGQDEDSLLVLAFAGVQLSGFHQDRVLLHLHHGAVNDQGLTSEG